MPTSITMSYLMTIIHNFRQQPQTIHVRYHQFSDLVGVQSLISFWYVLVELSDVIHDPSYLQTMLYCHFKVLMTMCWCHLYRPCSKLNVHCFLTDNRYFSPYY